MEIPADRAIEMASVVRSIKEGYDDLVGIKQVYVELSNGWEVSVITGGPLHGGNADGVLFEIAPIDPEGYLIDVGVEGYLTSEKVVDKILEIATR